MNEQPKSTPNQEIDVWPYEDIVSKYQAGNSAWRETSERIFWDQLEVLPPAAWKDGAFAVGEAYDHDDKGNPIHAIFSVVEGRFFCRLGNLRTFDPSAYQAEIRKQFNFDRQVFTCGICHLEKSTDEISDSKNNLLICEDCTIDAYLPSDN